MMMGLRSSSEKLSASSIACSGVRFKVSDTVLDALPLPFGLPLRCLRCLSCDAGVTAGADDGWASSSGSALSITSGPAAHDVCLCCLGCLCCDVHDRMVNRSLLGVQACNGMVHCVATGADTPACMLGKRW